MTEPIPPLGPAAAPAGPPSQSAGGNDAVGTALGTSRLWFTAAQGMVTAV